MHMIEIRGKTPEEYIQEAINRQTSQHISRYNLGNHLFGNIMGGAEC